MKKIISIASALAVSLFCFSAHAQHFSLGPAIGDDGLGIQVAYKINSNIQLRGGYSFYIPLSMNLDLSSVANSFGDTKGRDFSNIPVKVSTFPGGQGNLLCDIYPSKNSVFHFTAGALIGGGGVLGVKADLSQVLRPDEYASLAIGVEGGETISSDPEGNVYLDVNAWAIKPYVGIGFGRPVREDKKVTVNFDMGVAFWGKMNMQSYDYVVLGAERNIVPITSAAVANKDNGLIDKVCKIPVYPMLKLTVFFGIF